MIQFQGFSPSINAVGVSRTSPVYFEIRNYDSVAVKNTINVSINSVSAIINGVFQAGFTGAINDNARGFDVYIQHSIFTLGEVVNVAISVSDNNTANYTENYVFTVLITDTIAPMTIANPKGGTFASVQNVTLIANKPATIYYTIDGSLPDINSIVYSTPIVISDNTSLKFFSIDTSGNSDYIHVELYNFVTITHDSITPITAASPAAGMYDILDSVTLTSDKPSTIYWTLDENEWDVSKFNSDTSPINIVLQKQVKTTIKFFAIDYSGNKEDLKTAVYTSDIKENNIVPKNVFAIFPYIKNTVDLCWDDMMPINADIVGYNIYRSPIDAQYLQNIDSHDILTSDFVYSKEDSKFVRINRDLVTTTFYRDQRINRAVVKEDVSDQFKFKTIIDASTTFAGQIVNADYWEAIDEHRLFNQSDGIHFTDVYGNNRESIFQSKFRMRLDFDVETAYTLVGWPITGSIYYSEAGFEISIDEFSYIRVSIVRREAIDYLVSVYIKDSAEISRTETAISLLDNKFRIVRVGSTITTYYYDGVNWILIDSYLNVSIADLQVKFYVKSSDQTVNVVFSYFTINSGSSVLPLMKYVTDDYRCHIRYTPIVGTNDNVSGYSDSIDDVQVTIDNVEAIVRSVDGLKGIIVLETDRVFDNVLDEWVEPVLPTPESVVLVTYQYTINSFKMNLGQLPYYKVTAVLSDDSETRLNWCPPVTLQSDRLDYMYLEAIRRNSWLLDQAGERVLLFIKKSTGVKCDCYKQNERTHAQASIGSCKECWGTGFVGGYEGPYEIRISPFQTEQKINMTNRGMKLENIESTWTTVSPTLTQRDIIVRRKGQIYIIGPISSIEVRGLTTQQHFQTEYIDTTDIRYEFVQSLNLFNYNTQVGLRKPFEHYTKNPIVVDGEINKNDLNRTDKGPDFDDKKGRTLVFENTNF